ncbi:MAG: hypothetical protein ABFD89_29350 [Bryobacteraceae bacterium]
MATAENDTANAAGTEVTLEEPNFTEYRRFRETGDIDQAGKPVKDETSEAPGSDSTPAGSDGAAETPDNKQQEGEHSRRKPDAEKRISQLTRQRREAEDRANRLERELSELRQGKPEPKAAPKTEAKAPEKPKPEDFESYDEYEVAAAEYQEKLIDWKVDQRIARKAEQDSETAGQAKVREHQKAVAEAFQAQSEAARGKHEDFDEVLEANEQELPGHVMQTILESEVGAEMAYYLGTHPDELTAIADMNPLKAVKALGVIETKLSPTANRRPNTSKAPAPVRPVGGGKSAVTPESAENFEDYKRLRRQQEQAA